jgi:hypothetical protein
MNLSTEHLLSIARNYWPSDGNWWMHPENSPELQRFQALWRQEMEKMDQWRAFLRELGQQLPDFTLGNITTPRDACFRCGAYPNFIRKPYSLRWVVVGCVSILAPVYTLYGAQYEYSGEKRIRDTVFHEPLPPEMQAPAEVMARHIEATFGVSRLPREVAETPIPLFVEPVAPPHTNLFHALFISQPDRVP